MAVAKIEYENLRAEMARANIGIGDIAQTIGRNRDTAGRKLAMKAPFLLSEAFAIRDKYFPGMEIGCLFKEAIPTPAA